MAKNTEHEYGADPAWIRSVMGLPPSAPSMVGWFGPGAMGSTVIGGTGAMVDAWGHSVFPQMWRAGQVGSGPTVAGSAGVLSGATPVTGEGAYGKVPQVTSPQVTQAQAMQGNLAQLGNIQKLMAALDQQQAQNVLLPFQMGIPNWGPAMGQTMANVTQGLQGVVNSDVWTNLQRGAAERGIAMGSPLSPNAQTNLLQMLGLTSYGVQQDALKNLLNVMGSMPRISPFNPSQLLTTPAEQQQWQYLADLLKAAPDPAQARQAELAATQAGINMGNRGGYYQPLMTTPSGMTRRPVPADSTPPSVGPSYPPRTPYAPSGSYGSRYTDPISGESFSWNPKAGVYVNDRTGEQFSTAELDYALAPAQEEAASNLSDWPPLGAPGSYPSMTEAGSPYSGEPADWWLQGYDTPEDYDQAMYPDWYWEMGYFD